MVVRVSETYDGLWGELMFVMHDPDHLWRANEGRADWFESLGLGGGLSILDMGCGNGFVDMVLARRGHTVVGVDRVQTVINSARRLIDGEPVEFVTSDLRTVEFDDNRFDVVFMFGLVGLMNIADDTTLLERTKGWLKQTGALLVDCDLELAPTETTTAQHPDGVVYWNWTSDPTTRTNILTPELHRRDGVIVELEDPIDPMRGNHTGLHRYIYPRSELTRLLEDIGFLVSRVGHYLEYVFAESQPASFMLHARAPSN